MRTAKDALVSAAALRNGVGYARISDDDKGLAEGVESQHGEIGEVAEQEAINLLASFTDNDISASSGVERPDYAAMLTRIDQGDVRYVLCWHPDRLHRSPEELERFIRIARRHRIVVLTAMAGSFDLSTAYGRKALRAATTEAAYESEHRGERVALSRKRRARQGTYGGGVRPFGWGVTTDVVRRVLVDKETREYANVPMLDMTQHNPTEAAAIRRMRDQLLAGVSMRQVIADLKARGIPTAAQADGRRLKRKVSGGEAKLLEPTGWASRAIKQILTHPRVAGHSVYNGEIVARDVWPAIITEDERQALITLLNDPRRRTSPGTTPRWLGSLIYRCGMCEKDTVKVSRRSYDGLAAYRCRLHGHGTRDALALDAYVTEVLLGVLKRDAADLIANRSPEVDFPALRREEKALRERKKAQLRLHTGGVIDDDELAESLEGFNARLTEIKNQLVAGAAKSPLLDFVGVDDVRAVWDSKPLGEQREILRLVLTVTVLGGPAKVVDATTVRIEPASVTV